MQNVTFTRKFQTIVGEFSQFYVRRLYVVYLRSEDYATLVCYKIPYHEYFSATYKRGRGYCFNGEHSHQVPWRLPCIFWWTDP